MVEVHFDSAFSDAQAMRLERPFGDRRAAGRALARALTAKALTNPVVLALPRGGIPVAAEIARG
jgi:predicted phosphoribosyltransferase